MGKLLNAFALHLGAPHTMFQVVGPIGGAEELLRLLAIGIETEDQRDREMLGRVKAADNARLQCASTMSGTDAAAHPGKIDPEMP